MRCTVKEWQKYAETETDVDGYVEGGRRGVGFFLHNLLINQTLQFCFSLRPLFTKMAPYRLLGEYALPSTLALTGRPDFMHELAQGRSEVLK